MLEKVRSAKHDCKMDAEGQQALLELSAFYDTDPARVFERALEIVSRRFGDTMALLNLMKGDRLYYRSVVNPSPLAFTLESVFVGNAY